MLKLYTVFNIKLEYFKLFNHFTLLKLLQTFS